MKHSDKTKKWFILFFIVSVIILMLNSAGPLEGQFRTVGFFLFTLLCLAIAIISRKSAWKVTGIAAYWVVFGLVQMV
ncbi:hypothetical protein [Neobacillus niacini]|uniref:hypothetical protein n=1 Tax=Neobacillus niacini TaxID=86668 RepID=UPI001C8D217A|nr:hypothetical protein [Neobacillus niacini]MBY0148702.1 hypothetical protein [Neobacillus niacini]